MSLFKVKSINKRTTNLGFTMIELLMIMAIIGAMAGIILVQFPASAEKARDANRRSDIKQYQTELEKFANGNNGLYPNNSTSMSAVCQADIGNPANLCPHDPQFGVNPDYLYWGNGTRYLVWATLEYQPNGVQEFFVVCSNGLSDDTTTDPNAAGFPCPL